MQNRLFKPPKMYNRRLSMMKVLKVTESVEPVVDEEGKMVVRVEVKIPEMKKYNLKL